MTSLLLALLVLLPGLGSVAAAVTGRRPDVATAVGTVAASVSVVLAAGLMLLTRPWASGADTASIDIAWIGVLGSRLHLGWDGISAPLVVLTSLLTAGSCWYVWAGSDDTRPGPTTCLPAPPGLIACLLATEAAAIATFLARDLIVFFIGFEAVLIPVWLLIHRWGGDPEATSALAEQARKHSAASRFVLYTALGSAIMLIGLIWLALATGSTDFARLAVLAPQLEPSVQIGVAGLLIVGLGVKVPIWPLHSWLPPAHTIAPTVGSVLLAGVLLKLGSYGLVRLVGGFVPEGLARLAVPLGCFGVVGIIWGGLVCLVERDLKRLVAFSSVAHMGFVVLGVASGTPEGLQGALFVGVAHGVVTGMLFWVVGMIKHRHLTDRVEHAADLTHLPAGLRDSHPRLGGLLALGCVASSGLPGLAGFWGEMLSILGAWHSPSLGGAGPWLAGLAVVGTVLAAGYLFRVLYLIWHGPARPATSAAGTSPPGTSAPGTTSTSASAIAASTPGVAQARSSSVEVADARGVGPTTGRISAGSRAGEASQHDAGPHGPDLPGPDLPGPDLSGVELAVCAPLAIATIAFGVQPWLLLSLTGPAVRALVSGW